MSNVNTVGGLSHLGPIFSPKVIEVGSEEIRGFDRLKSDNAKLNLIGTWCANIGSEFELGKRLGGAIARNFASVYSCTFEGNRAVVKFRKPSGDVSIETVASVLAADRESLKSNLPGVPQFLGEIRDQGTSANVVAVFAQFIEGTPIHKALQKEKISKDDLKNALCTLLNKWESRTQPFYLADTNPDNFLLTKSGEIYLIDPEAISRHNRLHVFEGQELELAQPFPLPGHRSGVVCDSLESLELEDYSMGVDDYDFSDLDGEPALNEGPGGQYCKNEEIIELILRKCQE